MKAQVLHKAQSRGSANYGWLNSYHTFSFANYYNPDRMGFGVLRVLNDDVVQGGMGFETHSHRDMEIISIPLFGSLEHKDTLGNEFIIQKDEVQVMSAGTGISHSEYNASQNDKVNFLQIWVYPRKKMLKPSYSQKKFDRNKRENQFQLIVTPDGREDSVIIHQEAYFSLIDLKQSQKEYKKFKMDNGVYIFIISGLVDLNGEKLHSRDGLGIVGAGEIVLHSDIDSEILIMEIPMSI